MRFGSPGSAAVVPSTIGKRLQASAVLASVALVISLVGCSNGTEAGTNTLDLQIVRLMPRADNVIGEHAKWIVRINRSQFANQVAGL